MSQSNPVDLTGGDLPRPWYTLPSAIPALPLPQLQVTSSHLNIRNATSVTANQVTPAADSVDPEQQTERPWLQQILRRDDETVDEYIVRLEAECSHKPRPAQGENESKDDYAQRLWLRVYNKYCKRRSRHNERANYEQGTEAINSDNNQPSRGRNQPRPRRQDPSSAAPPVQAANHAHNNSPQQPPVRPYNDLESSAASEIQQRLLAQAAAGARLQEHVSARARQAAYRTQPFGSNHNTPLQETTLDEPILEFHGNLTTSGNFTRPNQHGAQQMPRQDNPSSGISLLPRWQNATPSRAQRPDNSLEETSIDEQTGADDVPIVPLCEEMSDEEFAHLLMDYNGDH